LIALSLNLKGLEYFPNARRDVAVFRLLAKRTQENTVDNRSLSSLFDRVDSPEEKLVTPASLAVDAVLVLAFFSFLFTVLRPHVQSHDPVNIVIWAGLTSACMSSVFWLAIQMFRVVYRAQHASKK